LTSPLIRARVEQHHLLFLGIGFAKQDAIVAPHCIEATVVQDPASPRLGHRTGGLAEEANLRQVWLLHDGLQHTRERLGHSGCTLAVSRLPAWLLIASRAAAGTFAMASNI
jgi:hypothetical protein